MLTPRLRKLVTDPNGRSVREGFEARVPRSASEMATYFRAAIAVYRAEHVGATEKARASKESAEHEHARHTDKGSPYTISIFMQTREVMLRRIQILKGDMSAQIVQLA